MPRAATAVINHVLTFINPSPPPNKGVSSFRFLANMLVAVDGWHGRTPQHFAALCVGRCVLTCVHRQGSVPQVGWCLCARCPCLFPSAAHYS